MLFFIVDLYLNPFKALPGGKNKNNQQPNKKHKLLIPAQNLSGPFAYHPSCQSCLGKNNFSSCSMGHKNESLTP